MTNSRFRKVWRCIVVYRDSKFHIIVTALGCLMLLTSVGEFIYSFLVPPVVTLRVLSVVTGSLWVIIVSQPVAPATGWMSFSFLFPYLSVSLAINIFICLLTVVRLLYHRACISKVLGSGYGMLYASFAAMIVESAAVYSICSLLYLVPYAANSPLANAFMQILGEAQVTCSLVHFFVFVLTRPGFVGHRTSSHHLPCFRRESLDERLDLTSCLFQPTGHPSAVDPTYPR